MAACSRLPQEKWAKLRNLLEETIGASSVSLRELQVQVGHFNFACRVVAPGHAFLHCLCDAMGCLELPHQRVRVSGFMRNDMCTWLEFLLSFNGTSFWRSECVLEAKLQVHLDAAGGSGFGVYFHG